jgi:2-oxoglutarate dehydrogenase E2 component (dihydrolipoamide succinyltransferase)
VTGALITVEVRAPLEQSEGTRSQIVRWLKAAGEPVARDEPLIEVETDKVTVEIAAPASGVLREILKQEREEITPGELLGWIDAGGATARPATPSGADLNIPRRSSATAAPGSVLDGAQRTARTEEPARVSPAVKRLLADHGLDPSAVRGTGPGGRITVDDVLRHSAAVREPASSRASVSISASAPESHARAAPGEAAPHEPAREAPQRAPGRLVPHSVLRKRIAEHMVRSLLQTAPHVTTAFEADFSAVLAHRARHRDALARKGVQLTLTVYILAACVAAIREVPEANARWTDEALEIFDRIDIGVATALPDRGLIVPVVRNVEALSLAQIAAELGRLVALAREDRLTPDDVRGGTFTVSNHGVSGSVIAAPVVINQPQVAILGVGKVEKRPVVVDESGDELIVAQPRAFITLTLDHRVMDGHQANRFLEVLVRRLESWPRD